MEMKDRRKPAEIIAIDQDLIKQGTAQLSSEIKLLEAWLHDLEQSTDYDQEATEAKQSYNDMLRSRKEMLNTLVHQSNTSH